MGLTFAEEDKGYLDALDWMERSDKLPRHLVGEALDLMTGRFDRIQARHEEKGHYEQKQIKGDSCQWTSSMTQTQSLAPQFQHSY